MFLFCCFLGCFFFVFGGVFNFVVFSFRFVRVWGFFVYVYGLGFFEGLLFFKVRLLLFLYLWL